LKNFNILISPCLLKTNKGFTIIFWSFSGFTTLHIVYFPEEIPYINHEAIILVSSALFFIASMKLKFKYSMIVSFIAIILGAFNFIAFTTMSLLYYKDLYLDAFI